MSSSAPATSSSGYDRPNRLKGREEGGIRWVELLEKFRAVQDRAKRIHRQSIDGDDAPFLGVSELRIGDGALDAKGKEARGPIGEAPPVPLKEAATAPPVPPVKKSGLGRQFGRLGGAVAGKGRRN